MLLLTRLFDISCASSTTTDEKIIAAKKIQTGTENVSRVPVLQLLVSLNGTFFFFCHARSLFLPPPPPPPPVTLWSAGGAGFLPSG